MATISNYITCPEVIAEAPKYMAVPAWLNISDKRWKALYDGTASLRHHYTKFFIHQNKECQIKTSEKFIFELDTALGTIANRYDYTKAGLEFAQATVNRLSDRWVLGILPLTRNMEACDFGVKAIIQEGEEIILRGGNDLRLMNQGLLEEDFLFRHLATESAFFTYSFAVWNHRYLQNPVQE